ncbi:hypothetical protein BD414DRAFT_415367 [Trametes punicea]|nr:hypothetical protein BD414DRAFT_415367 [Trametes punicea]
MEDHAHPELANLRDQLREIFTAMANLGPAKLAAKPPILDSSIDLGGRSSDEFNSHQDAIHGLRALREAVKRDLDVLEKFLGNPASASMPSLSTNAPYLVAVWNEVLHAPPPIATIWRTFPDVPQPASAPRRGSRKPPGVKVDVVAAGGKRWIRVNTTKNSRLLAEFREIDSYLTSSDDELSDEEARSGLAQTEFDNSILRMGRSLIDAARRNPLPGDAGVPSVTLRLTRLDPSPFNPKDYDPRVAQTIKHLHDMGINVELGEREFSHVFRASSSSPSPSRRLEPTLRINLDLSLLIALVSDITHALLPASPEEAEARYVPASQYREWKRKRLEACNRSNEEIDESCLWENGIGKHSRALANQALQETARELLQELRDRLAAVSSSSLEGVEFWTTPEARDRCLRIVLSKIGGPNEKRRASALFPSSDTSVSEAEAAYWENSRYPRAFLPLVPIRVFDSSVPPEDLNPPSSDVQRSFSSFFSLLARHCRDILAQETIVPPRRPSSPSQPALKTDAATAVPDHDGVGGRVINTEEDEIERAAVTKANPRLTAHTVQSLLWGAAHGWTTLTANKSSVKAILRGIRAAEGGYGWDENPELGQIDRTVAAIWVVDPRSLAEGMRSDYQA